MLPGHVRHTILTCTGIPVLAGGEFELSTSQLSLFQSSVEVIQTMLNHFFVERYFKQDLKLDKGKQSRPLLR